MKKILSHPFFSSDAENQIRWLTNPPVLTENGGIMSWINPCSNGFVYDEATAMFIKLMAYLYILTGKKNYLNKALKSAKYLSYAINAKRGIGKNNLIYLFDTGICLSAFLSLKKITSDKIILNPIARMTDFVIESIENRKAFVSENGNPSAPDTSNWSCFFGPHLLKLSIPLYEMYQDSADKFYLDQALSLCSEITAGTYQNGRFFIRPGSKAIYLHQHCYAAEGLLYLTKLGLNLYKSSLEGSLEFLADIQLEDGSIPAWLNCEDKDSSGSGDAAVQALRLWILYDKIRYTHNIKRAFSFMEQLKSRDGGLFYRKESMDQNSWVTMFYIQTVCFQSSDSDIKMIV
jgi:hypothetical protein